MRRNKHRRTVYVKRYTLVDDDDYKIVGSFIKRTVAKNWLD